MQEFIKQHSGLVWYWVNHYAPVCEDRGDIDRDDLYQAGCLGLLEAVQTFDSTKGSWSTWASFYIRRGIREALGRGKRLPTVPLDSPAYRDDSDVTLGEILPDETIIPDDDRQLTREIVETVRAAVDALPEDAAAVIRAVELRGLSRAEAARRMDAPESTIRRLHGQGLRALRRNRHIRALGDLDQETRFHAHKGVAAFHSSGSSVVEDLVEWRMRMEGLSTVK